MTALPTTQPTGGGDISASWQELAQIPQILADVRAGVYGLKALISTPAAAAGTGSPVASVAVVGLGVELAIFIARTVEAIGDDISGLGEVIENYQRTDTEVAGAANAGHGAINATSTPIVPNCHQGPITSPSLATPGFAPPSTGSSRSRSRSPQRRGGWRQPSSDPSLIDLFPLIGPGLIDVGDVLEDVIDDIVEGAVDGVTDTIADVTDDITDWIDDSTDWIDDVTDDVTDWLDDATDWVDEVIDDVTDVVDDVVDVVDDVVDEITDVVDDVVDVVDDVMDEITDVVDDVVDVVDDAVDEVTDWVKGWF